MQQLLHGINVINISKNLKQIRHHIQLTDMNGHHQSLHVIAIFMHHRQVILV